MAEAPEALSFVDYDPNMKFNVAGADFYEMQIWKISNLKTRPELNGRLAAVSPYPKLPGKPARVKAELIVDKTIVLVQPKNLVALTPENARDLEAADAEELACFTLALLSVSRLRHTINNEGDVVNDAPHSVGPSLVMTSGLLLPMVHADE